MDPGADDEEKPIGELFGRLIDDGKAYARAEAELAKARVACEADRAKKPIIFGAVGAALGFSALMALVFTLVLSVASVLGPLIGGGVVVLLLGLLTWLFVSLAQGAWKDRA